MNIDFRKEQEATLSRPPRKYGTLARALFWGMDMFYGRELSLGKIRLLEILARIPYQAWEIHQYHRLHHRFPDPHAVDAAEDIIEWGRDSQDNEFWHLRVVDEKMRQDRIKLHWFKDRIAPPIAAFKYNLFSRLLAFISIKTAFLLNADFEDHAEHEYMTFVKDHPELDSQHVDIPVVTNYGKFETWGDVFRRIALDERDHMNNSLIRAGRKAEVVSYASVKK